jgi:hypothetical protein
MDQAKSIKDQILAAQKKAAELVIRVREHTPLTRAFMREVVRRYVFFRYLLDEDDFAGSNLDEITEYSIAKSMKISKEIVKEIDVARTCVGISTAKTKKVLLFMAVQRDFEVYLPTEGTGLIKTVEDLADLIWNVIMVKPMFIPLYE